MVQHKKEKQREGDGQVKVWFLNSFDPFMDTRSIIEVNETSTQW